ncbi:TPA: hypothetical protein ACG33R_001399 [Escherichia coli]|jgi:homospermidine synthase
MQYLMLIMLVNAAGNIDYKEPTVYYARNACYDAQKVIKEMTPKNATVTLVTACVPRGRD